MIAAAMAGTLVLPAAGAGAAIEHGSDTPPPLSNASLSTNPLFSLAGDGFAAIGDLMHAVPILGPLAAGVAEAAFCAANFVPVVGAVTKASVNKFDKDQKQGNGCASSTSSAGSSTSSASAATSPSGSSTGSSSPSGTLPSISSPATHHHHSPSSISTIASTGAGSTATDHGTGTGHSTATDHSIPADHNATTATDHGTAGATDHGMGSALSSSSADKHIAQDVTFPKHPFQLRQGGGDTVNCLVQGGAMGTAVPGPCDAAAAWVYQSDTGELHPAADGAACLIAPTKDLNMVTIRSCTSAISWARHWYLSGTRRLFVRDADEHDSWRFLGAPGALVVGGVSQRSVAAVPVWSFPAA
jgi:hypothetical protein